MRVSQAAHLALVHRAQTVTGSRPPDEVIAGPYMQRWWMTLIHGHHPQATAPARSAHYQEYLHVIDGDDPAHALHDHPWWNVSVVIAGSYREVFADRVVIRQARDVVVRRATTAHRIEVVDGPVITWFITGRKTRDWGFRTQAGFVPFKGSVPHA